MSHDSFLEPGAVLPRSPSPLPSLFEAPLLSCRSQSSRRSTLRGAQELVPQLLQLFPIRENRKPAHDEAHRCVRGGSLRRYVCLLAVSAPRTELSFHSSLVFFAFHAESLAIPVGKEEQREDAVWLFLRLFEGIKSLSKKKKADFFCTLSAGETVFGWSLVQSSLQTGRSAGPGMQKHYPSRSVAQSSLCN